MAESTNDNGKVTLAVLSTKLDRLQSDVDKLVNASDCTEHDVAANSRKIAVLERQVETDGKEIDALKKRSTAWEFANSALAAIALVLGIRSQ